MLYRLCEITGDAHPDFLAQRITCNQLLGWQQYQRQAGYRHDIIDGVLTAAIHNQMRKKEDLVDPLDVMPYYEKPLPTPDEVEDKIRKLFNKKPTGDT